MRREQWIQLNLVPPAKLPDQEVWPRGSVPDPEPPPLPDSTATSPQGHRPPGDGTINAMRPYNPPPHPVVPDSGFQGHNAAALELQPLKVSKPVTVSSLHQEHPRNLNLEADTDLGVGTSSGRAVQADKAQGITQVRHFFFLNSCSANC